MKKKATGSCSDKGRGPPAAARPSNPFESVADDDTNLIGLLLSTPPSVPYDILRDEVKKCTGRDLPDFTIRRLRKYDESDKMSVAILLRREAVKSEIDIQLYTGMLEELRQEIARADDADFNKDKYNLQILIIDKIVKILQDKVGRYEKRFKEAKAEAEAPKQIATYNITPCEPEGEKIEAKGERPPEIDQDFY